MIFERGKAYLFWIILDQEGYIKDYVCTESPTKPEVDGRAVNVASLINERWEQVGEVHKVSGSLGGLPFGPRS